LQFDAPEVVAVGHGHALAAAPGNAFAPPKPYIAAKVKPFSSARYWTALLARRLIVASCPDCRKRVEERVELDERLVARRVLAAGDDGANGVIRPA